MIWINWICPSLIVTIEIMTWRRHGCPCVSMVTTIPRVSADRTIVHTVKGNVLATTWLLKRSYRTRVHTVTKHKPYGTRAQIIGTHVNSALHPSGVAKLSTSFGWGKGGKVTSAGWQVTLCDPIWHVISCSSVVISITNCYIRFTLLT